MAVYSVPAGLLWPLAVRLLLMGRITVTADSPGVGANLSDHPIVTVMRSTPKSRSLWERSGPRSLVRWHLTHSGPMVTKLKFCTGPSVRGRTPGGFPASLAPASLSMH